jgi:prepilin-type N-terminal cleavage/methylation domain-containing protein
MLIVGMRPPARLYQRGFTLVELLMGAAIIVLLVSVLIPSFSGPKTRATEAQVLACAKAIAAAQEMYQIERKTYTSDLRALDSETLAPCARVTVVPGTATESTYAFTVQKGPVSVILTERGIQR